MQSKPNMRPVWQYGHSRNDYPVRCLGAIAVVGLRIGCQFGRRHPKQFAAQRQFSGTMLVADETEVTNAMNPSGSTRPSPGELCA
jgi:hypothetical protein